MLLFLVSARCLCIINPLSLIYSLVEEKRINHMQGTAGIYIF